MVDSELHAAAAEGDIKRCATLLAGDSPPLPNAPDSEGRSAIFYAQVRGHAGVAKLLSTNGWTPMPEHNLWLGGPGGRAMWWSAGSWAVARPIAAQRSIPSQPQSGRAKASKRLERRLSGHRSGLSGRYGPSGPAHPWYHRKTAGESAAARANKKPGLNVSDVAEMHKRTGTERLIEAQLDFLARAAAPASCDAADEGEGEAAAPRSSRTAMLGEVARVVVARRPIWLDGSWKVVEPEPATRDESAMLCAGQELLLGAISEEFDGDVEWPALAAERAPLGWVLLSSDAVEADSDAASSFADAFDSCSDLDSEAGELVDFAPLAQSVAAGDDASASGDDASAEAASAAPPPTAGAWRGAVATRAAVGLGGAPAVFRPSDAAVAARAARMAVAPAAAAATAAPAEGAPVAGEGAPALSDSAGLKDARHVARGSKCMSHAAVEKRAAAKAKREAR